VFGVKMSWEVKYIDSMDIEEVEEMIEKVKK
jgi:hypothetical protein